MINKVSEYKAEAVLRDGTAVVVRAIRPEDKESINRVFPEIAPESLRLRFFRHIAELPDGALSRLTEVDFIDHVALVATIWSEGEEVLIGGGRYVRSGPQRAEVAFMVHDAFQGRGIASIIMAHLISIARHNGIAVFEAEVLLENRKMLSVFKRTGCPMQSDSVDTGVLHVTLSLVPAEQCSVLP